jgi:hypothetical protein
MLKAGCGSRNDGGGALYGAVAMYSAGCSRFDCQAGGDRQDPIIPSLDPKQVL